MPITVLQFFYPRLYNVWEPKNIWSKIAANEIDKWYLIHMGSQFINSIYALQYFTVPWLPTKEAQNFNVIFQCWQKSLNLIPVLFLRHFFHLVAQLSVGHSRLECSWRWFQAIFINQFSIYKKNYHQHDNQLFFHHSLDLNCRSPLPLQPNVSYTYNLAIFVQ